LSFIPYIPYGLYSLSNISAPESIRLDAGGINQSMEKRVKKDIEKIK
jgi:hypothetical protein